VGNQRTEFTYDGLSRRVAIRQLVNGSEVSRRRFVWCGDEICEERDGTGAVTKRFFPQGMKVESGPAAGNYYYTRDHLGSIRELIDGSGNVRARYEYDPWGRRTRLTGDMETDFGFAGMFWSAEANLSLTHFRAYDPELGRWLSRDPLPDAEMVEGPNLYVYVVNDPVNLSDPEGLSGTNLKLAKLCAASVTACREVLKAMGMVAAGGGTIGTAVQGVRRNAPAVQNVVNRGSQCAQSAAPQLNRVQTLPGMGAPDTINMFNQTAPLMARAAPPLRDMALQARRWEAWETFLANDAAGRFWQTWMDASRYWREYILTQEQNREVVAWISRWTESLFPR
jgi:RHS repeat-associated protein